MKAAIDIDFSGVLGGVLIGIQSLFTFGGKTQPLLSGSRFVLDGAVVLRAPSSGMNINARPVLSTVAIAPARDTLAMLYNTSRGTVTLGRGSFGKLLPWGVASAVMHTAAFYGVNKACHFVYPRLRASPSASIIVGVGWSCYAFRGILAAKVTQTIEEKLRDSEGRRILLGEAKYKGLVDFEVAGPTPARAHVDVFSHARGFFAGLISGLHKTARFVRVFVTKAKAIVNLSL